MFNCSFLSLLFLVCILSSCVSHKQNRKDTEGKSLCLVEGSRLVYLAGAESIIEELVFSALQDPGWNRVTGKYKEDVNNNRFVFDLLVKNSHFNKERSSCPQVKLATLEKVMVLPVQDIKKAYLSRRIRKASRPTDKVPYGALVFFTGIK